MTAFEQTNAYQLNRTLEMKLRDLLGSTRLPVKVLEAGCGSTSHIKLADQLLLTGIDISASQLDRNPHLQERICGDLQTHPLGKEKFDVVVCWDVIEHLSRPRDALANMAGALRAGGILVLAFPNLWSVKGLTTKLTPFWFHAWFYRRVMKDQSTREAFGQFPTYLRIDIAPRRLARIAAQYKLRSEYLLTYEGPVQEDLRKRHAWANAAFSVVGFLSRLLTVGRYDLNHSDCHLLLVKSA
jgi:SAM-dependent methyltransferase